MRSATNAVRRSVASARASSSTRRRAASSRSARLRERRSSTCVEPLGDVAATLLDPCGADLEVGAHRADPRAVVLEVLARLGHGAGLRGQLLLGGLELRQELLELGDPRGLAGVALDQLAEVGTECLELGPWPRRRHRPGAGQPRPGSGGATRWRRGPGWPPARHDAPRRRSPGLPRPARAHGRARRATTLSGRGPRRAQRRSPRNEPLRCASRRCRTGHHRGSRRLRRDAARRSGRPAPTHRRWPPRRTAGRRAPARCPAAAPSRPEGAHVAAYGLAHRRRRRRGPGDTVERQHGAVVVALAQRGERATGRVHVGDHDRAERFAGGGLEGLLPPRVDLDQVQEGAEHAVEPREVLRAGTLARLVERQGQRLDPGGPRRVLGLGVDGPLLGVRERELGRRPVAAAEVSTAASSSASAPRCGDALVLGLCRPRRRGARPALRATHGGTPAGCGRCGCARSRSAAQRAHHGCPPPRR